MRIVEGSSGCVGLAGGQVGHSQVKCEHAVGRSRFHRLLQLGNHGVGRSQFVVCPANLGFTVRQQSPSVSKLCQRQVRTQSRMWAPPGR